MLKIRRADLKRTLGYFNYITYTLNNRDVVIYECGKDDDADIFMSNLYFQIPKETTLTGFDVTLQNNDYRPILSETEFLNSKPKLLGFVKAD